MQHYLQWASLVSYAATGLLAATAARYACKREASRSRWWTWTIIALVFMMLAIGRYVGAEEALREAVRASFRMRGMYEHRQDVQRPIIAFLVLAVPLLGYVVWCMRPEARHGRRAQTVWLAQLATLAFAPLYALRVVSLHFTDTMLYAGPIRLNWVIDVGLCLTVSACACRFTSLCRNRS